MRNQLLTGYLLHHKPYQERRSLYYFFTEEHGVVHGVGKKGIPLFKPMSLFANGKRSLKTFTQIQAYYHADHNTNNTPQASLNGQNLYAGFYLNEILWKLLANENTHSSLWHAYRVAIENLQQQLTEIELRVLLRHFESVLFAELGCSISFSKDNLDKKISGEQTYQFIVDDGFSLLPKDTPINDTADNYLGEKLLEIGAYKNTNTEVTADMLRQWSKIHRQIIDFLLDYKELQSRKLWQQFHRYSQ